MSAQRALQIADQYEAAAQKAGHRRDVKATKAIATGPALTLTLADYRYTERMHLHPYDAQVVDYPTFRIPALAASPKWFMVSATDGSNGDFLDVFARQSPADPWQLALDVDEGEVLVPNPLPQAGGAQPADAASLAQGLSAIGAYARYLESGRTSPILADLTQAHAVRNNLASATKPQPGGTATLSCGATPIGPIYALQTISGSQLASSVDCTITVRAKPGYTQNLTGRWRGLAQKTTDLTYIHVHEVVEFSMILSTSGRATIVGDSWNSTSVTSH